MGEKAPVLFGPLWKRYEIFANEQPTRASAIVLVIAAVVFFGVSMSGIVPEPPGPDDEPVYINTVAGFVPFIIHLTILQLGVITPVVIMCGYVFTVGTGRTTPPVWYWRMLREHPVWSVIGTVIAAEGIELCVRMSQGL